MTRVMVVEDEAVTAMALEESLQRLGYEVAAVVSTGEEALTLAKQEHLDVILMDIRLRGLLDGITTAQRIRKEVDVPCVYVTAYSDLETIQRAKLAEPFGFLVKPYDEKELRAAIEIAVHHGGAERDRQEARRAIEARERTLQDLVDQSPAIIYIKDVEGRYILANRKFETAFRVLRGELRGKEDVEALPTYAATLAVADERVLRSGQAERMEQEIELADGARRYLALRSPLVHPDGSIYGVCTVLTDMTDPGLGQRELARVPDAKPFAARPG